jgi:Glycosyltransferase family 87
MLVHMVTVTESPSTWQRQIQSQSQSEPSRRTLRRLLDSALRQPAAWYAGFAVYAACVALFSGPGLDHWWGTWAAGGYGAAAAIATLRPGRHGQQTALASAVAGALVAPLTWLATQEPTTPDVAVVARSGILLLHHGTPYLSADQLAHGGWLAYNPYLPVMALFGVPKGLGLPGILGDPRPWLVVATFALLYATFRVCMGRSTTGRITTGRRGAVVLATFAIASPVVAFPLAMGITDPPIIALTCLSLALLTRARPANWQPAVVLAVACAMKYTAWPALAVLAVMVAARDGARAAVRFCAIAVGGAVALAVALAPAALSSPVAIIQNTVAYPLGLTAAKSPAQSPLPGHLLATLGPAGHAAAIALLAAAGLALVISLLIAPPRTPARAAGRIAIGLTALFTLSPATRFGYFVYPLALWGWVALSGHRERRIPTGHGQQPEDLTERPAELVC